MTTNATIEELYKALQAVNVQYDGNILFKREPENMSANRVAFTLTVKNSAKAGGRRSHSGRRIAAACWHVHGHFFEELLKVNDSVFIRSGLQGAKVINKDGGNWQDTNMGNAYFPFMASQACEC